MRPRETWEKGDGSNLCEAPFRSFRPMGSAPFFRRKHDIATNLALEN
jgi:hypothetical protein